MRITEPTGEHCCFERYTAINYPNGFMAHLGDQVTYQWTSHMEGDIEE